MHSKKVYRPALTTFMVAAGVLASSAFAQPVATAVMTGLDNPRGLAFAPNGALYVTEAGRGGAGPCVFNPGNGETRCFGMTGAITRWWKGEQARVIDGLESHANPDGSSASGATDISFQGTGGAFITMGLGGDADFQAALGGTYSGTLLHMATSGQWRIVADILDHEEDENPGGGAIDTNPYAVLAEPGSRIVVDAGGNALLRVAADGTVETLAVFPPQPNPLPIGPPMIESVPTTVARGPDGALYVGELTGFPFVPGLARIFRVVPGEDPEMVCSGFKAIIDIAFEPDGSLLVVENATNAFPPPPPLGPFSGRLSRLDLDDCSRTTVLAGLNRPTAVAVGPDGAVYVTNNGVTPGVGEVLRIPQ
jgi:DNA-binding beta-propeller fold protein YncE